MKVSVERNPNVSTPLGGQTQPLYLKRHVASEGRTSIGHVVYGRKNMGQNFYVEFQQQPEEYFNSPVIVHQPRYRGKPQKVCWIAELFFRETGLPSSCCLSLAISFPSRKKSESETEVAQSCLTLCDPVDCSPPGSSIHGIHQARILEWVAVSFSRRSSWPRDWTQVSRIAGRRFTLWANKEALLMSLPEINLSLLQILTFHCIWLHCASGTHTCTQKQKRRKLNLNIVEWICLWISFPILALSPLTSGLNHFVIVQSLNHVRLFATPWTAACKASLSLSFTISWSLLKLMSVESVMPSNHLILCHHFLFLPSNFLSSRVFSNESALRIRWPKDWSFSFTISNWLFYFIFKDLFSNELLKSNPMGQIQSTPGVRKSLAHWKILVNRVRVIKNTAGYGLVGVRATNEAQKTREDGPLGLVGGRVGS